MTDFTFSQLVDIERVQTLLQSHHYLSGMSYSLLDTEENILIAVGWQDICARFHRTHPATRARCHESDTFIKSHPQEGEKDFIEYRCGNGMVDVALPLVIDGRHAATFFVGQFFYDDDRPDQEFFRAQAALYGFDPDGYSRALTQVPTFSRDQVRLNVVFLRNMVQVLAEVGLKNLRLAQEREERKQTKYQLDLMGFALDHISEAVCLIDEQARFRYVNNEACRALGYSRDELFTRHVEDINPDLPMARWDDHWRDVKSRGSVIFEGCNEASDGHIFPVEIHATYFEFGGRGYHLTLTHDITGRRWMETLLRSSEKLFRTLTENSPNIIMRYDRECRRIYVNPSYSRETGIPVNLAQNVALEKKWPSGMNVSVRDYKSKLLRVMETGAPTEILLEWRRQDSERATSHVFNLVAEKDPAGVITGCLAIGHNISKLREAEFRLAKLSESSPGVMFTFLLRPDGSSRMPYVSVRFESLCGLRVEEVSENMFRALDRIHPDDLPRIRELIANSARTLTPLHAEFRIQHPSRGLVWIESHSTPEPQPDGCILWSGFFHDITKRKQAEESLGIKQKQLATMAVDLSLAEERERRRIASELHDHIGQMLLLSKIKLGSLAARVTEESDEDTYHEIQELLGQTINDVRSLTQQLNPPLLASVGLEAALEWLAKRMETDYSIRVLFSDDGNLKPLSEECRAVVFQSARELLINVAKYAKTREAWVNISRKADTLFLAVEDQGVGFDCAPNSIADISQNSSFGLFNIRQRINHLGGELEIESAPGCGTRATIRIPLTAD